MGLCVAFWSIFTRKNSPQITNANHMTMTMGRFRNGLITVRQEKVNIKLLDLCESLIVYILLSTCQWVHLALALNRPDKTFIKLFLSNIINHGESDVQWQISIYGSHLSVFGISLWKEKEALILSKVYNNFMGLLISVHKGSCVQNILVLVI